MFKRPCWQHRGISLIVSVLQGSFSSCNSLAVTCQLVLAKQHSTWCFDDCFTQANHLATIIFWSGMFLVLPQSIVFFFCGSKLIMVWEYNLSCIQHPLRHYRCVICVTRHWSLLLPSGYTCASRCFLVWGYSDLTPGILTLT